VALEGGQSAPVAVIIISLVVYLCTCMYVFLVRGCSEETPCLGGRAGALGRGLEGAVCSIRSPFSSLEETYADWRQETTQITHTFSLVITIG